MMIRTSALVPFVLTALASFAACAPRASSPGGPQAVVVTDAEGHARPLTAALAPGKTTVVTFFSAHCPCQRAHDARLIALYEQYHPRGVEFLALDAEARATPASDVAESKERHYPFPLLTNADGAAADAFGVVSATHTLVFDGDGRVRYTGAIDSDRKSLSADAHPYLQEALDDVLAGRDVRTPSGKVLGCALER